MLTAMDKASVWMIAWMCVFVRDVSMFKRLHNILEGSVISMDITTSVANYSSGFLHA